MRDVGRHEHRRALNMPPWTQLESDLSTWLKTFARPGLEYRGPNQAILGFPSDWFRSDGLLTDGRVLLAIEVEASQMHPDTNVGKYWLLQRHRAFDKTILFHIYTPAYNSYKSRKALGEFYAEKMKSEMPLEYIQLDCRQATDYHATLTHLRTQIEPRVNSEFVDAPQAARL
jgi:hypothetical protein